MTREEFIAARKSLGVTSQSRWAELLGLSREQVNRIEAGAARIMPMTARLVEMYRRHGIAADD